MYKYLFDLDLSNPKVRKLIDDWSSSIEKPPINHPTLYHYCSTEGLFGILSDGALWATAAEFSNDLTEVRFATEIAIANLSKFECSMEFAPTVQFVREYLAENKGQTQSAFIFSFCKSDDLLSQWRGYGNKGGFAVGFHPVLVAEPYEKTIGPNFFIAGKSVTREVSYLEEEQQGRFSTICTGVQEVRKKIVKEGFEIDLTDRFLRFLLLSEVIGWIHTVKNMAFREEQEWRIVAFPLPKAITENLELPTNDEEFRVLRGAITPYIRLKPLGNSHLPIKRIVCGPTSDPDYQLKAVNRALNGFGYQNIEVVSSTVPLRS
jgi:hypothetical protein